MVGNRCAHPNNPSLIYTSSEDDLYTNSASGEDSTNICSCSSPSTAITSVSGTTAVKIQQNVKPQPHTEQNKIPSGDDLQIEDIELRFEITL